MDGESLLVSPSVGRGGQCGVVLRKGLCGTRRRQLVSAIACSVLVVASLAAVLVGVLWPVEPGVELSFATPDGFTISAAGAHLKLDVVLDISNPNRYSITLL